jgi:hypothetical protein
MRENRIRARWLNGKKQGERREQQSSHGAN